MKLVNVKIGLVRRKLIQRQLSFNSQAILCPRDYISLEKKRSAQNYHPIPVVLSKGYGANVW